jgi:pimeloyl-ACP methyl ester carboxylesterase
MILKSLMSILIGGGQPPFNLQFRQSDPEIVKLFRKAGKKIRIVYDSVGELRVRSLVSPEDPKLPWVVFIHGAPGSSMDYYAYLKDDRLTSSVNMMSIDRPGYGYSAFGRSVTSIDRQADVISQVITKRCAGRPVVLVGHSFGGPIAARIAMKYRELSSALIMLAPAIDPENEKTLKIAYLGIMPVFRDVIPVAFRVAADEKFTHQNELAKIADSWSDINIPVCHIHGKKDRLVPYDNLAFSRSVVAESQLLALTLDDEDHFLPWTQRALITKWILTYAAK